MVRFPAAQPGFGNRGYATFSDEKSRTSNKPHQGVFSPIFFTHSFRSIVLRSRLKFLSGFSQILRLSRPIYGSNPRPPPWLRRCWFSAVFFKSLTLPIFLSAHHTFYDTLFRGCVYFQMFFCKIPTPFQKHPSQPNQLFLAAFTFNTFYRGYSARRWNAISLIKHLDIRRISDARTQKQVVCKTN